MLETEINWRRPVRTVMLVLLRVCRWNPFWGWVPLYSSLDINVCFWGPCRLLSSLGAACKLSHEVTMPLEVCVPSGFLSLGKSASGSHWKFNGHGELAKTHFRKINFYRDSKLGAGGMVQFYSLLLWRICLSWFNNVHIIENNKTVIQFF